MRHWGTRSHPSLGLFAASLHPPFKGFSAFAGGVGCSTRLSFCFDERPLGLVLFEVCSG